MAAVDGHALEAVAVVAAFFLAGAVVAGLTHLTEKLHLDFEGFLVETLLIELVLHDCKLVAVNFHNDTPLFLSGAA